MVKLLLVVLTFLFSGVCLAVDWNVRTALDEYIARPEPAYKWAVVAEFDYTVDRGVYVYMLNFTSQTWLNDSISDRSVWWHWMSVAVPVNYIHKDAAIIYVKGGGNGDVNDIPDPLDDVEMLLSMNMSRDVGLVACVLKQVPNQDIIFKNDPTEEGRSEDEAIAYTWTMYRETRDPNVILQLPMTKSVIKAMDTTHDFMKTIVPESNITQFMVAGGSKRGWVTWTAACTDKRVNAIAPIVLSCLNFVDNLHHHYRSLGGYTWVFNDYYYQNLTLYLDDPVTQEMMNIIDPYEYRERLTMPKLMMSATGDEFFMPDDSNYFFHDLPEPMYMIMIQNTNHGMPGAYERLMFAIESFYKAVLTKADMPKMRWTRNETETGGSITLWTDRFPKEIEAWGSITNSSYMRDYRWSDLEGLQPIFWRSKNTEQIDSMAYRIDYTKPADGAWQAFFINVKFHGSEPGFVYDFTTEVNYIPDVFYYDDCEGAGCYGTLV